MTEKASNDNRGPGGWKADQDKPRPDLLAWDVVNGLPGLFNKTELHRMEPEFRDSVAADIQLMQGWFYGALPSQAIYQAFAKVTHMVGEWTAVERDIAIDPREAVALGLMEISKVLAFGAMKYAARNWEKGIAYSRVYAAALRHGMAFMSGETLDPETKLSHLAHMACCLMFLATFEFRNMAATWDDRKASLVS